MTQTMLAEMNVWESEWVASIKELNQWDVLKDFANHQAVSDSMLLVECAWRMPQWQLMNDALQQVPYSSSIVNFLSWGATFLEKFDCSSCRFAF